MNSKIAYTVTQINNHAKSVLENNIKHIYVKGEVSSFKIYESGHAYFIIKDNDSEINCVYFNYSSNSTIQVVENIEVIIFGSINYYMKKGRVQAIE